MLQKRDFIHVGPEKAENKIKYVYIYKKNSNFRLFCFCPQ